MTLPVSDITKPLPEKMLTYHQYGPVAVTLQVTALEMIMLSLNELCLKIIH